MQRIEQDAPRADWIERVKWTTLARVVALSALLMFAVAMDLGMGPQPMAPAPNAILYQLITVGFVLSFIALLCTYLLGDRHQQPLAWASLGIDALLTGGLVAASNGLDSVFLFTLPLAVLSGAVLVERAGAFAAAAFGTCVLFLMASLDLAWLDWDMDALTMSWVRALGPRVHPAPFDVALAFMVQVGALYATALLSSHLMVELSAARDRARADASALSALRVRFADVVSSMPDGLATLTGDDTITTVNPVFLRIVGLDESEVVGRPLAEVLPEYAAASAPGVGLTQTTEITRDGLDEPAEVRRQRGSSAQILAIRSVGLAGADHVGGTVIIVRDITELRLREVAHRSRERLAAVGAMAMAVAHEIRNPLASISGAIQMLAGRHGTESGDRELMDIAVRETSQLSAWIGEFLDFARPQRLNFMTLDLAQVVGDKVAACRNDPAVKEAEIDIRLRPVPPPDGLDWSLIGDESRLGSLVWNLLTNARQAALESGERVVEVTLVATAADLILMVADSGRGVSDADKPHVFEPFYTTKGEGTGLGLATVRRAVQSHGGRLEVRDGRLGGAEFVARLPRRPPQDAVAVED